MNRRHFMKASALLPFGGAAKKELNIVNIEEYHKHEPRDLPQELCCKNEAQKCFDDCLIYGTGTLYIDNQGKCTHIPIESIE